MRGFNRKALTAALSDQGKLNATKLLVTDLLRSKNGYFSDQVPETASAASLLILVWDNGGAEPSIVLQVRPQHMRTAPGAIVFPGGKIDPNEHPEDAAIREFNEEMFQAPLLKKDALIGALPPFVRKVPTVNGERSFWLAPIVAWSDLRFEMNPSKAEVDRVILSPVKHWLDSEDDLYTPQNESEPLLDGNAIALLCLKKILISN